MISSRHYHAVWLLSPNGDIIWQLGGRNSTFQVADDAGFQYQHDAQWVEQGQTLRWVPFIDASLCKSHASPQ